MQRYKFPRTPHLHYSKVTDTTDRKLVSDTNFFAKQVVVTLKMDGENTSIYSDGFVHARSINSGPHQSRSWVKAFAQTLNLPEDFRVCGENMWAKHTISYDNLDSYFLAFNLWAGDQCSEWEATEAFFKEYGIPTVPIIYKGMYDKKVILEKFAPYEKEHEGFVVRKTASFLYEDYPINVAKYVRESFVPKESKHWFSKAIVKNHLQKL